MAAAITYQSRPDSNWSCLDWINWHKALRRDGHFTQEQANTAILTAASQVGFFASEHWCPYDSDFVAYFRAQGIDPGNVISNVVVDSTTALQNLAQGASKGISLFGAAIPYTTVALLSIVVIGVGIFVWNFSRKGEIPLNQADLLMKGLSK